MSISLNINGNEHTLDVDEDMPLLWAIRDIVGLTGTKFGCGLAQCGACTVHVDGEPTRSCQYTVSDAEGSTITTIEGVNGKVAETVQQVWTGPGCAAVWLLSIRANPGRRSAVE